MKITDSIRDRLTAAQEENSALRERLGRADSAYAAAAELCQCKDREIARLSRERAEAEEAAAAALWKLEKANSLRARTDENLADARRAILWMLGYPVPGKGGFPLCVQKRLRFVWRDVARKYFESVRVAEKKFKGAGCPAADAPAIPAEIEP